jgi:peptidoglycan/LPS O-acetylase OafA/YrhL
MSDPATTQSMHRLVQRHMPALDGLRGIAILLVLAHGFDVIRTQTGPGHDIDLVLDLGWIGVQLFFVLSGFLITGILLDTQGSPTYYRSFFARRVLRIFPLYYGVLIVAYALVPLIATPPPGHGDHQVWLWTYTANFAEPLGKSEPAFPHFWSLCVEEQFYLVWPFVVRFAGRVGVIVLGVALVGVAIGSRLYVRQRWGDDAAYMFTPCRMDALAIGAVAAALVRGERIGRRLVAWGPKRTAIVGALVVVAGSVLGHLSRTGPTMQTGGYSLLALGFAIVMMGALSPQALPARLLSMSWLRRVGTYSYGMYVFHAPLHLFVGLPILAQIAPSPGTSTGLVYAAIATLATFGAGAVSYHVYERRFLAWKPPR